MSNRDRTDWDNDQPTNVDKWLAIYERDDNLPWATNNGHLVNVIDELLYRLEYTEEKTNERIINLLDAEIERIWKIKDYPATNALANIRAELIKGEQK